MKKIFCTTTLALFLAGMTVSKGYAQDRIPREYTNPDEVVTFDRTTPFPRALDVINEFSQKYLNKIVIDRTGTDGTIGISIPPMHWRDALDLMLRVKSLQLVEQPDYFEIVAPETESENAQGQEGGGGEAQPEQLANLNTREVRIHAIFFEGNRRALQEVGVDWSTLTDNVPETVGDFVSGGASGGGGEGGQLPATSGFDNQFVSVNTKGAQSVSQNVFNALVNFGQIGNSGIRVQALLSAFEADNLGEILASPSVKVMDGQEGHIQVGQDFSIKQRDFAGNVTDQFFSVGTILTVTPTIIEQNDTTFVHLNIHAERSSAQPDPVSTIVNKQTAETQALLRNGEATAVAGLYRSEVAEVRRGIPILKDLPPWLFGLRYLFGYNSKDYQMRELVVLVQADIEPSVAERYGEPLENKFKVLNDERQRIRDEIDQKDQYSPTRLQQLDENDDSQQEIEQQEDSLEVSQQAVSDVEENKDENREAIDENSMTEEEENSDDIVDLEVAPKAVPLNLGASETEEEKETTPDTALAESPNEIESRPADTTTNNTPAEEPVGAGSGDTNAVTNPAVNQSNFSYYIIGASFSNRDNAENFSDNLSEQGFNPTILTNESSTFHYVAYSGYETLQEAQSELEYIRRNQNPNAWLYTQN